MIKSIKMLFSYSLIIVLAIVSRHTSSSQATASANHEVSHKMIKNSNAKNGYRFTNIHKSEGIGRLLQVLGDGCRNNIVDRDNENAVILVGTEEQIDTIQDLLFHFDEETRFCALTPIHISLDTANRILKEQLGVVGVNGIHADKGSNTIYISARVSKIAQAKEIMKSIDKE
jgi:type II secretory pathway component GspD/PulD (secretin)